MQREGGRLGRLPFVFLRSEGLFHMRLHHVPRDQAIDRNRYELEGESEYLKVDHRSHQPESTEAKTDERKYQRDDAGPVFERPKPPAHERAKHGASEEN